MFIVKFFRKVFYFTDRAEASQFIFCMFDALFDSGRLKELTNTFEGWARSHAVRDDDWTAKHQRAYDNLRENFYTAYRKSELFEMLDAWKKLGVDVYGVSLEEIFPTRLGEVDFELVAKSLSK